MLLPTYLVLLLATYSLTTSASPKPLAPLETSISNTPQAKPLCDSLNQAGIASPAPHSTVYFDKYGYAVFDLVFCSGKHDGFMTVSGDAWYRFNSSDGELLAVDVIPDNRDSGPSHDSSYRVTVSLFSTSCDLYFGPASLAFYERATGPGPIGQTYSIYTVDLIFAPHEAICPSTSTKRSTSVCGPSSTSRTHSTTPHPTTSKTKHSSTSTSTTTKAHLSPSKTTSTSTCSESITLKDHRVIPRQDSVTNTVSTTTHSFQPLCTLLGDSGIKHPKNGTVIYVNPEGPTNITFVYCSGQYFKTSSLSGDVLLNTYGGLTGGELLALNVQPDDRDAVTGSFSYRLTVQIYPEDGDSYYGNAKLSFFEVASGYYNSYNYYVDTIDVVFEKKPKPSKTTAITHTTTSSHSTKSMTTTTTSKSSKTSKTSSNPSHPSTTTTSVPPVYTLPPPVYTMPSLLEPRAYAQPLMAKIITHTTSAGSFR